MAAERELTAVENEEPKYVLELNGETFICKPDLKLGFLLRTARAENQLAGIYDLLTRAVPEEEHERLFAVTDEMDLEDLAEPVQTLIEKYTERPTVQPSPSRPGRRATGRK